jgi:hypothetical protein
VIVAPVKGVGGSSRRDREKEQFWRKAIGRFLASNLSKSQFCKKEGLSIDLLRYWTAAIAQRDEERRLVESRKAKQPDKTFLPVVVVEHKAPDRLPGTQQMAVAEMVFAGGSVLVFNGITTDTVRALWLALREGIK